MKQKHTISNVTAGLMIGLAFVIDVIQFLLTITVLLAPLSIVFTFIASTSFALWFFLCGVNYSQNRGSKLMIMIAQTVGELAPIINSLPITTMGVIGMIVQTRFEDARKNKGKKVTPRTAEATLRLERIRRMREARAAKAQETSGE